MNNDFLPDSQFFGVVVVMASIGCLWLAVYGVYTEPAEPTISGADLAAVLV